MKKIIITTGITLIFIYTNAQSSIDMAMMADSSNRPIEAAGWKGTGLDSATFADVYGTMGEYNMERGLSYSNAGRDGGGRVVLIGMKEYWFNEVSIFLQYNGYGLGKTKTIGNKEIWPFTERVVSNRNPYKLTATISLNKENRMIAITITGPIIPIIDLFVGYWNDPGASRPYLSNNGSVRRNFLGDKIILKRIANNGIITITK